MLKIVLLRHFATAGNLRKRYIGSTDEPLCKEGIRVLDHIHYPKVEAVFTSPLIRCQETAKLIYPEISPIICMNLRECDFGEFENKSYEELSNNPKYQAWVDSNGTLPFPMGEDPKAFKKRCVMAFQAVVEKSLKAGYRTIALVVHGGTIMSILECYATPKKDYYYWHSENGKGYIADIEESKGRMINLCTIH